jgi:predicted nucleotidyltransferase
VDYLKDLLKNREALVDIILFGSSVRGKLRPKDLDVLLIFSSEVDWDLVMEVRDKLKGTVESVTYREIEKMEGPLKEAIFSEGVSLSWNSRFIDVYGFNPFDFFFYSPPRVKKRTFYFALYGRGNKEGILERSRGIKISNNFVVVPVDSSDVLREFFRTWGVNSYSFRALIQGSKIEALRKGLDKVAGPY